MKLVRTVLVFSVLGVVVVITAACESEKLKRAYAVGEAIYETVCALPADNVVRQQIRRNVAKAGLDTSRVCEDGWSALLASVPADEEGSL